MKVQILADSQEEFDAKRSVLVRALSRSGNIPTEARKPHFKAQGEVNQMWDEKFKQMLEEIKREIDEIIK